MSLTAIETDVRNAGAALFADPLRFRLVMLLTRERLCTCHLTEETGAKQTTISHHLRVLRQAGLVDSEPHGRFTYYRLRPQALAELAGHLGDLGTATRDAASKRRPC